MKGNAIILAVASLMVLSTLALSVNYNPGTNQPVSLPQLLPGPVHQGNVTIYQNGTVSSPGVASVSGNTYTLLQDINGTLKVNRNDTTINGDGASLNGLGSIAVFAVNVTGITLNNLEIVNSTPGIFLSGDGSISIGNITVHEMSTIGTTMVTAYYSSSLTIMDSNFIFGSAGYTSYGISAQGINSVNTSGNYFTGANYGYFLQSLYGAYFVANGNVINSTHGSKDGTGMLIGDTQHITASNNHLNNTFMGISITGAGTALLSGNGVTNSSEGIVVANTNNYVSSNEYATHDGIPLSISTNANVAIQGGNYTYSSYSYFAHDANVSITNSNFSNSTNYGIEISDTGNAYIANSTFNETQIFGAMGIYADQVTGRLSLYHDIINQSGGNGVYAVNTPEITIAHSSIAAFYDVNIVGPSLYDSSFTHNNMDTISSSGSGINSNSLSYLSNVNISGNIFTTSAVERGNAAISLGISQSASHISVTGNSISGYVHGVNIYGIAVGYGLNISDNSIQNTYSSIYVTGYSNVIISSNNILNTKGYGIYVGGGSIVNVVVENNTVETLPSYGNLLYGIEVTFVYGGSSYVRGNTVVANGTVGKDLYLFADTGLAVYSNKLVNGSMGIESLSNTHDSIFLNSIIGAYTGLDSQSEVNATFYENTFVNTNVSFYSSSATSEYIFANTFVDNQANASVSMVQIHDSGFITLYHNNFLNETTNSSVSNTVTTTNGGPVLFYENLPVGGNYWSNYTGAGSNGIGSTPYTVSGTYVDLYPLTSKWSSPTVTFVETGLTQGTQWHATLGGNMKAGTGSSILFNQANGQYTSQGFEIAPVAGYTASITSGTLNLNSTDKVVLVTFSPVMYKVSFTESNLPSGTTWSVTLDGHTMSSSSQQIVFMEANGTYNYTIGSVSGYSVSGHATGNITVSSSSGTVAAKYSEISYNLTVRETGLAFGDSWSVSVVNHTYNSTATSITLHLYSGDYNITVSGPNGYSVKLPSSSVNMTDKAASLTATFSSNITAGNTGSGSSAKSMAEGIGIGVVVGGIVGALGGMVYFRKLK